MELRHTKYHHTDPVKLTALLMPPHPTAAEVTRIDFDRVARTIPDTKALRAGFLAWSLDERLSTTAARFDMPVSRIQVALCDLRHRIEHVDHPDRWTDPPVDLAMRLWPARGDWKLWATGESYQHRVYSHPPRRVPVVSLADFASGKVGAGVKADLAGRLMQAASYDICTIGSSMVAFTDDVGAFEPKMLEMKEELHGFVTKRIITEADYFYFCRHALTVQSALSVLKKARHFEPHFSDGKVPDHKREMLHENVTDATARLLSKLGTANSIETQMWDGHYECLDVRDLTAAVHNNLFTWKEAALAITEPLEYLHLRWALAGKKLLD